ncbi:MAG: YihY/virulence factor BrkB family protein [Chloroflexi bacterium]|nr:YihY/virulence factor BrkB family protein [Chloroflexota bacterium]
MAGHVRLGVIIRLTVQQTGPHHLSAFAGNLAYNGFLAVFPFVLFLLSILRALHAADLLAGFVDVLAASVPATSAQFLRDQLQPEMVTRLPSSGWLSVLLALGSLWAVSAVFRAATAAMNVMHETDDRRPLWLRLGLSIVLSVAAAALLLTALVLIMAGSQVAALASQAFHLAAPFSLIWNTVQWTMLVAFAFFAFALIYYFAPDVQRPVRAVSPGALSATLAWLVFSLAFSWVLNRFGGVLVDPLYGWFTGLIVLLLYLYWSAFILLVGAEVNHVVENTRGVSR